MQSNPKCFSDTLTQEEAKRATFDPSQDALVLTPDNENEVDFTRSRKGSTYKPTGIVGINHETGQVVFWFEEIFEEV